MWQLQFTFSAPKRSPTHGAAAMPPRSGWDPGLSEEAAVLARELGLPRLAKRIIVTWNPRMRSTAGRAIWPKGLVELNPALEQVADGEIRRTFLHELAHLVAFERSRRRIKPHGQEWQRACVELGIAGESASHHLPLPTRRMQKKWRYVCPKCWANVERVRRMQGDNACYSCCRRFSGGSYDQRFRFLEQKLGA